jgi:NADPH-dependent 2,4-dienoyl-CoA reductase/sulfur reductase-like enzyme
LKKQGIRNVQVVDREPEAGGVPRLCHHTGFGREDLWRMYSGPRYARYYRELAEKMEVEIWTSTAITGWSNDASHLTQRDNPRSSGATHSLRFTSPNGIGDIEAQAVLLATGVRERPRSARLIPGTRPQGIFTTGSLQRFVYQEHLPVGKRALIVGAELVSLSALLTLIHAGVKCVGMVTDLPQHQIYFPYLPMKWALADGLARTRVITSAHVSNILGQKRVEGLEISYTNGETETIECDTVIFTGDWIPEHELARLGGLSMDKGTRGPSIDGEFRSSVKGVFAAGNLLRGVATADACALEGQRAARAMARYLRGADWSEQALEVQVDEPLTWVCPNRLRPVQSEEPDPFRFRSNEFRKDIKLQVSQGEAVYHTQSFRRLIVNEIMQVNGDWARQVNPAGLPIRLSLVN